MHEERESHKREIAAMREEMAAMREEVKMTFQEELKKNLHEERECHRRELNQQLAEQKRENNVVMEQQKKEYEAKMKQLEQMLTQMRGETIVTVLDKNNVEHCGANHSG